MKTPDTLTCRGFIVNLLMQNRSCLWRGHGWLGNSIPLTASMILPLLSR
jgi:hypothetical protein